ncbi:MAG: hypothetical protein MUO51_09675 [Woeseiaceae bacterium]|nr:hypothetical protein [Woeseiaceae bacterium]
MYKKDKTPRDAFTLSLGGMTTISSFATAPAIAADRLREVRVDCEPKPSTVVTPVRWGRFWLNGFRRSRVA